ncbi:HNH endonuclease [Rhodococcus sp. NPDC060176]|uniref:HNH endonuclease n=1 Tax=Rhodococcus sp. NPDC060176 TaxID=3347062 RepID=UPI00364E9BB6
MCAVCGKDFPKPARSGPVPSRCSSECKKVGDRLRASEWYARHKDDPALKLRQAKASRRHWEKVRSDPELLANHRGLLEQWRESNPDKISAQYKAWRLEHPEKVRAKNQRRRARLLDAFVEDVDLQVVWQRDGGVCQLCDTAIDPEIEWPHRQSRTLDHIIPLSRGGEHSYANVQLAHHSCNSRKNDSIPCLTG